MKKLTTFLLIITSALILSQDLPHYMTPDELKLWETYQHPVSSDFITPPPVPVRVMAEWEELDGVAITWTSYTLQLRQIVQYAQSEGLVYIICSDSNTVKNYLTSGGVPLVNLKFIIAPFNSVWIRDYGPWSVYSNSADSMMFIDWIYNRPRPNDDQIPVHIANFMNVPLYQTTTSPYDFIATGGNFMTDGHGTGFSSKLILNENPGKTEAQIDTIMKKFMGLNRYIKMNNLPYDQIHHIDMHMKLLDEETLLVGQYPPGVADGPQIEANLQYVLNNFLTCYGRPYKVVRILQPPDQNGNYPGSGGSYRTYTNSVIINKTVIIPTYEVKYDTIAFRIYREAMPGYRIVGVNSNSIITALGAIHCITKELGSKEPVFISHAKINDPRPEGEAVEVKAYIKTRTGVANASVYWTTDTTQSFTAVPMNHIASDTFTAYIPSHLSGTRIFYYITASSVSGRSFSKPVPAPQGVYEFIYTDPVPVELISFTASSESDRITLKWITASELNNRGFVIEKKAGMHDWETCSFISGKGTTTELSYYSFIDEGLNPGKYFYRLVQEDYDGTRTVSEAVSADVLYKQFHLAQNYPNPFNPSTRIKYSLPYRDGSSYTVTLKIYDVLGNEIAVLVNSEQAAGDYEADVDMRNLAGGVYFYELRTGEYTAVNKMILQK
jgi:agmatine deiminase